MIILRTLNLERRWKLYVSLLVGFSLLTWFWYAYMPMLSHWPTIFRPAIYKIFSFQTPYTDPLFYNPPWALIPLMPFALLPERLGWALPASTTFFAFAYTAYKMGAKWYLILAMLLIPQTLYNGLQVNVDWLVALGFLMPHKIGLLFIMMKPQLGLPLTLFRFNEAWRADSWRKALSTFWPISYRSFYPLAGYRSVTAPDQRRGASPPRGIPQISDQQNPRRQSARLGCLRQHRPWFKPAAGISFPGSRPPSSNPGTGHPENGVGSSLCSSQPESAPRIALVSKIPDRVQKINHFLKLSV